MQRPLPYNLSSVASGGPRFGPYSGSHTPTVGETVGRVVNGGTQRFPHPLDGKRWVPQEPDRPACVPQRPILRPHTAPGTIPPAVLAELLRAARRAS